MNGYVYKLTLTPQKEPEKIEYYYGSTLDISRREREHIKHYNNDFNKKHYPIKVVLEVLEIIDGCITINEEKLRKAEQHYIDNYENINTSNAWTGKYKHITTEEQKRKQKLYKQKNLEKITEYQNNYRNDPINKARKLELSEINKETRKKDRQKRLCCIKCKTEMGQGNLHKHLKICRG
tara:strand:- start:242 stop:778 length:537 start_codon:yes stop_codon:yes gene_type:complete